MVHTRVSTHDFSFFWVSGLTAYLDLNTDDNFGTTTIIIIKNYNVFTGTPAQVQRQSITKWKCTRLLYTALGFYSTTGAWWRRAGPTRRSCCGSWWRTSGARRGPRRRPSSSRRPRPRRPRPPYYRTPLSES